MMLIANDSSKKGNTTISIDIYLKKDEISEIDGI